MIRRNYLVGTVAIGLMCIGCGPANTDSEPSHSPLPATTSPTASTVGSSSSTPPTAETTFPAGATPYYPAISNACGLAGNARQAIPLGCSAGDTSVITYGSTNSLSIDSGTGIPALSGAQLVDGKTLVAIRTGERPNITGAVSIIDGEAGSTTVVDLGSRLPAAVASAKHGILIGTTDGRVVLVSVSGQITDVGSVDSPVAAVALAGSRIWVLQDSGSLDWIATSGGGAVHVADIAKFKREGMVATGGDLWILTGNQRIRRFRGEGEIEPLAVPSSSLSLTECANGVWLRGATAGDVTKYTLLSRSGHEVTEWTPPAFLGYSACAGVAVWGLSVNGALFKSPDAGK